MPMRTTSRIFKVERAGGNRVGSDLELLLESSFHQEVI